MDSSLIVSGIQAILRAAQAGVDIYTDAKIDRDSYLSNIRIAPQDITESITRYIDQNRQLTKTSPFIEGWNKQGGMWRPLNNDNLQACIAAYTMHTQVNAQGPLASGASMGIAGGHMISQWRKDKAPPSVLAQVAVTITDIGLTFISQNPALMGQHSKGEALIMSFAGSLSELIPDSANHFGKGLDFESRLLGIFLQAGLSTLANNNNAAIDNASVNALVKGIITPLVKALPSNLNEQFHYRELVQTLLGPSTANALSIIANTPQAYLGERLASQTALNAVTTALLTASVTTANNTNITDVFSKDGLQKILDAILNVAIEQPTLFVKNDQLPQSAALTDLLVQTAELMKSVQHNQAISSNFTAQLSAIVIGAVSKHANVLIKVDPNNPWETIAFNMSKTLLTTISSNLSVNARFASFSPQQRLEFASIVLNEFTQYPHLLATHSRGILNIVEGMAAVMKQDKYFLLSNHDWLDIIKTVTSLAAMNPQLLCDIPDTQGQTIKYLEGSQIIIISTISSVLAAVNKNKKVESHSKQLTIVVQGITLRIVIQTVLEALAKDISGLKQEADILQQYFAILLNQVDEFPYKWGSRNIINFVESTIESLYEQGEIPVSLTGLELRN